MRKGRAYTISDAAFWMVCLVRAARAIVWDVSGLSRRRDNDFMFFEGMDNNNMSTLSTSLKETYIS